MTRNIFLGLFSRLHETFLVFSGYLDFVLFKFYQHIGFVKKFSAVCYIKIKKQS